MFRLNIRHRTTYRYGSAVEFGRHRLVVRPREGHDLRITRMQILIEPAHRLTWSRDVYGNSIALVDFDLPADRLEIINDVVIERHPPFPVRQFHQPSVIAWPVHYPIEELALVDAYRALSYPEELSAVRSWLAARPLKRTEDAEGMLHDLCRRLHETIRYRRRSERGVQSPLQTIQSGSGSCRDMATLLMDAARILGMASRFASGYLHGSASLAGRASTHAWTEVYLPALGWRGLDPTTGEATGLQHVATGLSQHPRGVMPISGSYVGPGVTFLGLEVEVLTKEVA